MKQENNDNKTENMENEIENVQNKEELDEIKEENAKGQSMEDQEESNSKEGKTEEKAEDNSKEERAEDNGEEEKNEEKAEENSEEGKTEEKAEDNSEEGKAEEKAEENSEEGKTEEKAKDNSKEEKNKEKAEEKTEKKTKKKKKILIPVGVFIVLIVVCCCVYSVIAYSYKDRFLPGTWVNGIDCTEMDGAQVADLLNNQLQTYSLSITGRDYASGALGTVLGEVTAEDIHLVYGGNSRKAVDDLLAEQNIFTWLYRKVSDDTYSFQLSQGVSYDEEQLRNIVSGWEACQSGNMTAPQNAYIGEYSESLKGYEIVPEVEGTKFDVQKLVELMDVAILSQETSLDLEAEGCYEAPAVREDAVELTEPVETANKWLGASITYDWNGAEIVVDDGLLKDWITMEKDGPVLDEAAVAAFVKEQAEENDTYRKRKSFMTTLGVELSLNSRSYGWLTDQEAETKELIEIICQGKTVSREPVYASTARQKGMSDIGNSYVEVDLTHQHLYLYEGGSIIFETDFVSGNMSSDPGCVTPEGIFGITYKTTNAVLRGADYETPVSYWMPFFGNYGMHDATWRSEFGGQIYITNGSHGCVNLPLGSAATIYEHMSTGFPVICYYYQVDPLAQQPVEEDWDDDEE